MRIVFMGSPEFSVPALDALLQAGHEIVAVYCQPPRPAGRGKKDRPTAVQARAEALGLCVRHPVSLKGEDEHARFAALKPDVAVVVAYGLILPQAILDTPAQGCLNIHASLLPRWRGAAPIHRAIMARDAETGVCIMQMEAGLDTGPVLLREAIPIAPDDTNGTLHDRLSQIGAALVVTALERLDELAATPQSRQGVTYARKIDKAEARIDWGWTAAEVDAHIRGLSPFPGAWTSHGEDRLKLLLSQTVPGCGAPGQVLDDRLAVACGRGAVRLLRLQRAGRGAQDTAEFLRGMPIVKGVRLR
jgi:methionyl-tRNA formyltransferase